MVWSRSWVDAFPVRRRFDTADRSIVISSDTSSTQATIDAWHGCDVLIHEASRLEWLTKRPDLQPYAAKYHTNTRQLAELASKGKPRLLIIDHASIVLRPALRPQASSPEELLTRSALRVQPGKWLLGGISMFIKKNTPSRNIYNSRPSWSPQGWRNRLDSSESNSMAMGKR
jgi:hypothetical protein